MYHENGDFGLVRMVTLLPTPQSRSLFSLHTIGWHRCNDLYRITRPNGCETHLVLITTKGRGGATAERAGEPCRNRGPARVLQPKQLHPRVQARIRHDAARVPPHALPPDGAHGGMTRSRRAGCVPGFPRRNAHKKNIKRKTEALCHIAAVLPFFASGSAALAETARRGRRPSRPFRSGPGSIRFSSSFRLCTAP